MKKFEDLTEEEKKQYYNIAKLSIAAWFDRGLPSAAFLSNRSAEIGRLVQLSNKEIQEAYDKIHYDVSEMAFLRSSVRPIGFAKKE